METPFTCDSPTLPAQAALKERFDRQDTRDSLNREVEDYLHNVRKTERMDVLVAVSFGYLSA